MASRHDASFYVHMWTCDFPAVFKMFQLSSIGVVPESESKMAQARTLCPSPCTGAINHHGTHLRSSSPGASLVSTVQQLYEPVGAWTGSVGASHACTKLWACCARAPFITHKQAFAKVSVPRISSALC